MVTTTVSENCLPGQRSFSSAMIVAPVSATRREPQGSGAQAASIWPRAIIADCSALGTGRMLCDPGLLQLGRQVMAGGDVLRVAVLRRGDALAVEIGKVAMPEPLRATMTTPLAAAPADHADALSLAAGEGARARAGADVADVDLAGEERLDRARARR